jgi:hypothetical protein
MYSSVQGASQACRSLHITNLAPMVPLISSFLVQLFLLAQFSSAQILSSSSTSLRPRILSNIASLSESIPATVLSGARNATTTASPSSPSSSTAADVTAIAGIPTSSARINGTASTTASSRPRPSNTTPCNGYPEFCYRKYSNISMVVAHNSPFVKEHNAASNQQLPVLTQLNDGIRGCKSKEVESTTSGLMYYESVIRNAEAKHIDRNSIVPYIMRPPRRRHSTLVPDHCPKLA